MECGSACLRMIAKYHGKHFNAKTLKQLTGFNHEGVSFLNLETASAQLGFKTQGVLVRFDELKSIFRQPCIIHWDNNHFVVLVKIFQKGRFLGKSNTEYLQIADPAKGLVNYKKNEFLKYWLSGHDETLFNTGTVLLFEPTESFFLQQEEAEQSFKWKHVFGYLKNSRHQIIKVGMTLGLASVLQFVFPYFTKSIVDKGIEGKDINYVALILVGQLVLMFSRTIIEFIQNNVLFKISTYINLSLLADFWLKLTKLPVSYFENHHTGDTLQRISDHRQIESFLTGSVINSVFSVFSFLVFSVILFFYSPLLFLVFATGSALYFFWIKIFLGKRRKLNYELFNVSARENNLSLQLVQGMHDIRLYNAVEDKRNEWSKLQLAFNKLSLKSMYYGQLQQGGAIFLNEGRNVLITFLVARMVINGSLSFGIMVAVQYIIGRLSSPVEQFIAFIQATQDTKISIERLNEIHSLPDEESDNRDNFAKLPSGKTIQLVNLNFKYLGSDTDVLKNLNLKFEEGKVSAIVGMSGSGKSTLVKLLLRFFDGYSGQIKVDNIDFCNISPALWRSRCSAVLPNGFIFDDTIANNITVRRRDVDREKLGEACRMANFLSFVESLPAGFNTRLGSEGVSLSQGQKQRLLIARSIYKDADYLFFDEATNALDTNNEKQIMENLLPFITGKTVVIIAHRLSTVKNADKIFVFDKGRLIEEGNHKSLCSLKGKYFELVKNQLELDV